MDSLVFRTLSGEEIKNVYPRLFAEGFGYDNEIQCPSTVIVFEKENEIAGFMSGYWMDRQQFYIQFFSVLPKFRNPKLILPRIYTQAMKFVGARFYFTITKNDDFVSMKGLLGLKFSPVGIRQDTGGQLWLEWIKGA